MNNEYEFLSASTDSEQALLGGLLSIGEANNELFTKALGMVKPNSFYKLGHRKLFEAIRFIAKKNGYVDMITTHEYLDAAGDSDNCGGMMYISELIKEHRHTSGNLIAYAKIVRDYAIERFAIEKMMNSIGVLQDRSQGDIRQRLGLIESMASQINNMALSDERGGLKHISEGMGEWLDDIEEIREAGFDKNALSTGIDSLDDVLGRRLLRRGGLYAIGARPKQGKTALMTFLSNHIGLELKLPVANFSMEMPSKEIVERCLTTRESINPDEFYKRGFSEETQGRLDRAFSDFTESNIYIDDGSSLTLEHIVSQSRTIRNQKGDLGAILVDYLTLMEAGQAERNDLAYGAITKGLKNLAKELNCVVILLTQLNRGLETRVDKRPMASDSRDTGQIEQDVDGWIGIYKESTYDESAYYPGLIELVVRLNRHGGVGTGFVEMKQGYITPVETQEGQRIINHREMSNSKPEKKDFS